MHNALTEFVAFYLKEKRKNAQKCQKYENKENVSGVEIWKIISLLHYKFISSQPWYFFWFLYFLINPKKSRVPKNSKKIRIIDFSEKKISFSVESLFLLIH